jgi:hypothetical protein
VIAWAPKRALCWKAPRLRRCRCFRVGFRDPILQPLLPQAHERAAGSISPEVRRKAEAGVQLLRGWAWGRADSEPLQAARP